MIAFAKIQKALTIKGRIDKFNYIKVKHFNF